MNLTGFADGVAIGCPQQTVTMLGNAPGTGGQLFALLTSLAIGANNMSPDKSWKASLFALIVCSLLGHRWRPSPNVEQYISSPCDPTDVQPWGIFVRCTRCHKPDPLWTSPRYPDEEDPTNA